MHNGRLPTLVGGIFARIGLALLCVTIALAVSTASFLASAERTDGTVVELTARTSTTRNSDGHTRRSTTWYPTVEFTVDGKQYSFESSTGSNPPAYTKGESLPVAYDPDDPYNGQNLLVLVSVPRPNDDRRAGRAVHPDRHDLVPQGTAYRSRRA